MSTDVHTLSGAYALDALSPEEAEEFRRHLEECQACRDEVQEFQRAAARMGAAEELAPPPHLKARVLAAADRTPQSPPAVASLADRRRRPMLAWLGAAAAAVLLVVGGVVGLRAVLEQGAPELAPSAAQVFQAEDARTATVETANGGRLTVGISQSRNEMAVDTRELPPLEEGRVYQIWSVQGESMASAAVLEDPAQGAAMEMPAEETEVAITVEPRGGSEQPTGDPIVQVDPYGV